MNGKAWSRADDERLTAEWLRTKSGKRALKLFPERSYASVRARLKHLRKLGKLPPGRVRGPKVQFGRHVAIAVTPETWDRIEKLRIERFAYQTETVRFLIESALNAMEGKTETD